MNRIFNCIPVLFLFGLANSCDSQELNYSRITEFGNFKYTESDTHSVGDFLSTCEKKIPVICKELNIDFDNSVTIEIYPNQDSYNNSILNKEHINSPAISGGLKIQLISPLAPLYVENKIGPVQYADRLSFLVHEYTHILLDRLEVPPPLCIDEGIASYYSSREFYLDMASKYIKQINFIPSTEQLIDNYHKVPAPDLFSFLLIDYMVQRDGKECLQRIIRQPGSIRQMNDDWIEYVEKQYY